jgi:hypothetical protein
MAKPIVSMPNALLLPERIETINVVSLAAAFSTTSDELSQGKNWDDRFSADRW